MGPCCIVGLGALSVRTLVVRGEGGGGFGRGGGVLGGGVPH